MISHDKTRKLGMFIASYSVKTWRIVNIITLSLALILILSSKHFIYHNIINDGISNADVIAKQTVAIINEKETQRLKDESASKIKPVLGPIQESANSVIKEKLANVLAAITMVRESGRNKDEQIQELTTLLPIDQQVLEYIVYLSNKEWKTFKKNSIDITNKVLAEGITLENLQDENYELIKKYVPRMISTTGKEGLSIFVHQVLRPNRVVDDVATKIKIEEAQNSVNPVIETFKKGQKILDRGDIVTPVKMEALKKLGYVGTKFNVYACIGVLAFVGIFVLVIFYYLRRFAPDVYNTPRRLGAVVTLIIIMAAIFRFLPDGIPIYGLPVASIALLLSIIVNARVSILISSMSILLIGVTLSYNLVPITVLIVGIVVGVFSSSQMSHSKRSELASTGIIVAFAHFVMIVSSSLFTGTGEIISINTVITDAIAGVTSGCLSGIIAIGTLPYIESIFKITTPYSIAELADHNHPILKRMQFEAPGTYHHSLMVSDLSSAAAAAIGANANLVKVGCMYHDIGKIKRPLFYIENQAYFGVENPHDKLNPRLSKMIIAAHPKDGLEMAKNLGLPEEIAQFIDKHHGTSVTGYFYNQACQQEGPENVDKNMYRHSGRKPDNKETAIVMLADGSESAVRSIKNQTPGAIEAMVDKIIKTKLEDGQLDESSLTLKDLKTIKEVFCRVLRGIHHDRIEYPESVEKELAKNKTNVADISQAKEKRQNV